MCILYSVMLSVQVVINEVKVILWVWIPRVYYSRVRTFFFFFIILPKVQLELHLNMHTSLTLGSWSELIMLYSHCVGT